MTQSRRTPGDALALLVGGAAALARGDDLDSTIGEILGAALPAVDGDSAAVFLQDPDRLGLELVGAGGIDPAGIERLRAAVGGTSDPISVAARERTAADLDSSSPLVSELGWTSAALRPLVTRRGGIEEPAGVLVVGWQSGRGAGDAELLEAVANLIAVAAERARLTAQVAERSEWFERMAHSDPLTGLANARTFNRVLELELARASRQGGEVSVAIFDVDGLAQANASNGNKVGDDILRQVAAVLSESVRLVDTVARWGGDEFVLVAPGSAGMTVARRVLEGVGRLDSVGGLRVAVSGGVARFPNDGTDAQALLDAADSALKRVKSSGGGAIGEASAARA